MKGSGSEDGEKHGGIQRKKKGRSTGRQARRISSTRLDIDIARCRVPVMSHVRVEVWWCSGWTIDQQVGSSVLCMPRVVSLDKNCSLLYPS